MDKHIINIEPISKKRLMAQILRSYVFGFFLMELIFLALTYYQSDILTPIIMNFTFILKLAILIVFGFVFYQFKIFLFVLAFLSAGKFIFSYKKLAKNPSSSLPFMLVGIIYFLIESIWLILSNFLMNQSWVSDKIPAIARHLIFSTPLQTAANILFFYIIVYYIWENIFDDIFKDQMLKDDDDFE